VQLSQMLLLPEF